MGGSVGIIWLLPAARMTSTDSNDLMPAQEKLEWVPPKISLVAGETADWTAETESTISVHRKPKSSIRKQRAILTDFTSNPAIPTKTSHPKGSAKTLFY